MLKKAFLLLFLSATFLSCRVTFVPQKSPTMIVDVMDVQTSTNSLYDKMITATDKTYPLYETEYSAIDQKIDSILQRDKQRNHGKNIVSQVSILQKYFRKYEADHKARGALTSGEFKVYKEYLKSFIKPVLVSELSLK